MSDQKPLVKGGQGRSSQDLLDDFSAWAMAATVVVAILLIVLAAVRLFR